MHSTITCKISLAGRQ